MYRLHDTGRCYVSFTGLSKAGNPAPLEGVVLGSSNPDILAVGQDETGLYFEAVGRLGTAQLQIQADALPGEGADLIYGVEDIEIVAGRAKVIQAQFGTVVEKPDPAPPVDPPAPPVEPPVELEPAGEPGAGG